MYTLRRISGQNVQMNHALGDSYTVVTYHESTEQFRLALGVTDDKSGVTEDGVYAFVSNHDGSFVQPLYSGQKNYIMTNDGKTFSNLTLRK